MTARGRNSSSTDWDPMRDDFNDTSYDAQYPDNDSSGRALQTVPLDHKKLYIRNVPAGLNEHGLRTAFEKYGQVEQVFLSRDPTKKYGLIRYETAAEARIAMMKLNRTEPLNLHVYLAHAKQPDRGSNRDRGQRDATDSGSYVSSSKENKSRNQEEIMNEHDEQLDNTMGLDHNFHLEMEKIKLDQLRIQEEQLKCRQKMMMLQLQKRPNLVQATATVSSSRRLLPDGRVIVQERVQEPDASCTGAGDSLNIPGLQRVSEKCCIVCGARADMYCARCALAPYCSERCQRTDWFKRHSSVCHNLVRLQAGRKADTSAEIADENSNVPVNSPPAPLRRPHSPGAGLGLSPRNAPMTNGNVDQKGPGQMPRARAQAPHCKNTNKTKFVPPGHHTPQLRQPRAPTRPNQNQTDDADEEWGPAAQKPVEQKHKADKTPAIAAPKMFEPKVEIQPKVETQPQVETPKPQVQSPIPETENVPPVRKPSLPVEIKTETKPRTPPVSFEPSHFLVEKLPIGESFLLLVDQPTSKCATKQAGFVCLAAHADYQTQFNDLLGDIYDGETTIVPSPGALFAYLDTSDEGWYRARCLNPARCALLDGSRLAEIAAPAQCRAVAPRYREIPEFSTVLQGNVEVGQSIKCTILMKTAEGYKVSMDSTTEDRYLGEGLVNRWLPEVETPPPAKPSATAHTTQSTAIPAQEQFNPEPKPSKPQPVPDQKPQSVESAASDTKPAIPDIDRPDVINNGRYILLHVTSLTRACVRPCEDAAAAEFESVLNDAAMYGIQKAKRLESPPTAGDVVLSHYEGVHYRALVIRTKAADDRYMVQYAEYGNEEVVSLQKLYVCPPELSLAARPTRASIVSLSDAQCTLTPPASEYLDKLKEDVQLIATIPTGEKSVRSGSLVHLCVAKNKENVSKKLEAMCTPEWKMLEAAGGDVIESDVILFPSMNTLPLPTDREYTLEVTDFVHLEKGIVSGYEQGQLLPAEVYGPLTDRINEYCNSSLCADPYLPMVEELCLAKLEPYPQWFRAVVLEHKPGASTASLLYVDYGTVADAVPVAHLRKCMPEFASYPALAAAVDIKGWPQHVTREQLVQAVEFLNIDDEGRGHLPVRRCYKGEDEMSFIIEAPALLAAINASDLFLKSVN